MPSFLGGKLRRAFGQPGVFVGGKSYDHRRYRKRDCFKKLKFI